MNRAQRRAARQAGMAQQVINYCVAYRCPDCDADTDLVVVEGVAVLEISHDNTCPILRRLTA